jgi:hypothetical protein
MYSLERKYISGSTKSSGVETISALLQALKESPMKVVLHLVLESSMPNLISQRETSPSPCGVQL